MTKLNVSISKFIADMHVEIWWSRKICFFFIQTCFSSVQVRSFLYLDAHDRPSSLQHIVPLGLTYTTFHILHQVSSWNSQQYIGHILKTLDFRSREGGKKIHFKNQTGENK